MTFPLTAVSEAIGAAAAWPGVVTGWSVDSRTLAAGDLFFALRGPTHDGHDHVAEAFARGAAGAVVERDVAAAGPVLRTPDTLAALQRAAAWARSQWGGDVAGVTGSAGKTTTKDVIAALLASAFPVGKTAGNFNNHVGVPLSILRLPAEARVAVLEIGMNHAGEIRRLAAIARPRIAVVTNVGYAHLENFESVEGIAAAKRELVEALPPDGVAVLNADDPRVSRFAGACPGRVITYGIDAPAQVRADAVECTPAGVRFRVDAAEFTSPLAGRHNVRNILAGIAVARVYGIAAGQLREAAAALVPGPMRGERIVHNGITLWNDCYNSNPDAAKTMIDVLGDTPATRRIAVLGEMRELGAWAETLHREVGRHAAARGVSVLVGIGGAARQMVEAARAAGLSAGAAHFFEAPEEAGEFVRTLARPGDAILWKGSRATRVEKALERFLG